MAPSDWYPSNNKCDIVTVDVYANAGDHSVSKSHLDALYGVTVDQRILALGEVGVIPDPERQAFDNVLWAYWMIWNGNFIRDGNSNSRNFLMSTFANTRVVTLGGPSPLGK
ncbi:Mannan endo-1,4-beta-mannosidase man26A [Paramyrothecium foliicola]|nr:Mannan endo-1,4-beta-mannosidase man26A [Paramyrothecium foliicola]